MTVSRWALPQVWHADHIRKQARGKGRYGTQHADPFDTCPVCLKSKAVCERKIRLVGWAEAVEWQNDYNETHNYVEPVVTYGCRWCWAYHLKTAREPGDRKRAERARRKWLQQKASSSKR